MLKCVFSLRDSPLKFESAIRRPKKQKRILHGRSGKTRRGRRDFNRPDLLGKYLLFFTQIKKTRTFEELKTF